MTREKMHKEIEQRIKTLNPPADDLLKDVRSIFLHDNNQSLQGITCAVWIDTLFKMTDTELSAYASRYKAGALDPWKISPQ